MSLGELTCSAGTTTFLKFVLAWLLSAHQVVLLCGDSETHVFYRGTMYLRQMEPLGFGNLPLHKLGVYCPVWTLIDVEYWDRGPPFLGSAIVWPVQTGSPVLIRFKLWSKQVDAALLGVPLWSLKELVEGYVFFTRSMLSMVSAVDPILSLCHLTGMFGAD